jgi:hypothetical protein
MIARLESMPLDQARNEITTGVFAAIGSPNHEFAVSWLSGKEAELRSARDAEMLAIARNSLPVTDASKKKQWYENPAGLLLIGILSSLLAAFLFYLYGPR